MKDAIRELLKGKNFTTVLNEYGLFKYELLDAIGDKIFRDYSSTPDEIETLKSIYTKEAIMFNLNAQKIMLISDTHMENKHHENLNYLDWAFEFCKQNNIHCLIHGGDIGDGTEPGTYKPLEFSEVPPGVAQKQVDEISKKYKRIPEIIQFVLAGNHDERYKKHHDKIDILKEIAIRNNIYPVGYYQAFFNVCGFTISLEHSNGSVIETDLIPHDFAIKGHSHKWEPNKDNIFIPTLSNNICHQKEMGKPGFVIMQPSQTLDELTLQFDRYTFKNEEPHFQEQASYSLVRQKR